MVRGSSRGYTLIEIMIVLGLILLVFTASLVSLNTVDAEKRMREVISPFDRLSQSARALAKQNQKVYQLVITQESLQLQALDFEKESEKRVLLTEAALSELGELVDEKHLFPSKEEFQFEILRWGETIWEPLGKESKHVLRFDPTGLCEPIGVKVVSGKSWIQQQVHPLTARFDPNEERFSIEAE